MTALRVSPVQLGEPGPAPAASPPPAIALADLTR
jgi:hypothetical protein